MRRTMMLKITCGLAALTLLAACGGGPTGSTGSGDKEGMKVGLAYDIGGRGDKSFNDAAAAAMDKATQELGVPKPKELSAKAGETDAERAERLDLLATSGHNPVIAVGFIYAKALAEVAPKHKETRFAIVDGQPADVKADNVANLIFAPAEGSFLVGVAAGLKAKSGKIGFVGGCTVDLIKEFEAGFLQGVEEANPKAKVKSEYLSTPQDTVPCSGFNDAAKGKETAKGMYDDGAEIVYHAAGGSGPGVFEAAKAADKKAIGVDSDQYETADPKVKDVIITSMLKRVDVAVFDFVKDQKDGNFTAGPKTYDLKADGVGYSTSGGQIDDIKDKLEDYKKKIIDGEIKVKTKP